MVHLLKRTETTTTKHRLMIFFTLALSIAILLNIVTVGVHVTIVKRYDRNMSRLLNLNQFYIQLDEINEYLRTYTQIGDVEQQKAIEECRQKMNYFLYELRGRKENIAFRRDVTDVRKLIQTYEESLEEIYQYMGEVKENKMQPELAAKISQEYEQMQNIYQVIRGEFKTLGMEMMEDIETEKEMVSSRENFYYIELLVMLVILLGIGLFYARELSNKISVPIQALTNASEEILSGKLAQFQKVQIVEEKLDAEMKILIDAFNTMLERIKKQVQEIQENASAKVALREKELENLQITNLLRTSELKALQMQMNPHFLFNTLNMIAKTAYMEESDKTAFLLQKTAQLLRYSLDYMGKSVTLAREIEMLGNYVYLQEQRFGERIMFEFELDEKFHQMQIPCLILQPLVENAITHGVGGYLNHGKIKIRTKYHEKEQMGEICVEDNGLGMTQEQQEQLKKDLNSPKMQREKIGLANVYMRIHLFYGEKVKFEMTSIPKVKTKICICIPYQIKSEEEQVEERSIAGRCIEF